MSDRVGITSPLSIIELPQQIDSLEAKFQYYAYEPDERVTIESLEDRINYYELSAGNVAEMSPRFVEINIGHGLHQHANEMITVITPTMEYASEQIKDVGYADAKIEEASFKEAIQMITKAVVDSGDKLELFTHSSTPGEGSLYFTQDFCQGFVRKTAGDGVNSTQLKQSLADQLEEKTVLDYVKTSLSGSLFQEGDIDLYEDKLMSGVNSLEDGSQLVILDPNTLLPTSEAVFDRAEGIASDAYVSSSHVHQIFTRTNASPVGETISRRTVEIAELVENQAESEKENRYLSSFKVQVFQNTNRGEGILIPECLYMGTPQELAIAPPRDLFDELRWLHVGFQVQKYVIEGDNRVYRGSFFLQKESDVVSTKFRDPYIIYGKEYYYEIRDAWICIKTIGQLGRYNPKSESLGVSLEDTFKFEDIMAIVENSKKELSDGTLDWSLIRDKMGDENFRALQDNVADIYGFTSYSDVTTDIIGNIFSERRIATHSLGFLILGTQTTGIDVSAREKFPPLPPSGFSFEYQGNSEIEITWNKNVKIWEGVNTFDSNAVPINIPADDIGGFLLFVRNNLSDAYELYRQFHLTSKNRSPKLTSDGIEITSELREAYVVDIPSTILGCNIGDNNIEYNKDADSFSHVLSLRSNVDYYIGMASYDVHGNISPYSEQFFIRRNNVTGEILTTNICGAGAPLSYPNIMIPSKFVLSSMKASGYRYLEVFQTPSTQYSYPSGGKMTIQLIDIETEADAIIEGFPQEDPE